MFRATVEFDMNTFSALNSGPLGDAYRSGVIVERDQFMLLRGQHLADRFRTGRAGAIAFVFRAVGRRAIALAGYQ